ncbi:MAG: serine/threonine protein kinase [Phycisphaerae bacterium]|nr:serine/threonine protein kinase [Phycisphaerae bacterium]
MDKRSIFGLEPDQLDELLSVVTGDFDASELDKAESSSPDDANPSKKSQLAGITVSLHGSIEQSGSQIGRYKLLHALGEGGMGIVYLAEQKQPIRRQVALKVIKPGMDSKRVIARFEAERQALALLDHPNIAHVHDAGTTEAGRPYFVMEYVKGLSIAEHCDRHKLTIEDRLNLFRQICLAIHHAHQKGIIHRDIKPSNILVSTEDDKATPKIIDFGVAKALAQPLTERTLATEESQLLGTPEYMSPEQADMASEDIDTRSDIYSLGVLLYVLLTGALPFDSTTFREGGIDRIRQIIRETDPKTPSTRLTNLGEDAIKVARSRQTDIAALAKKLHKELEWIPLKAMRKERAERYRSASELADDVENYLKGAPLLAGPLSTVYRLKKLVQRNRALVTGIAAILAVLVAGIVVSTLYALGQTRARAEAQLIADFLENDVLGSASRAREGEATLIYLLDAASKTLEGKFKDKPLIEASIRETLGWTYRAIGEPEKAEQHSLRAIEIYRQHYGQEHPATLRATDNIGWVYQDQGRYHDMERLWTKNLKIRQRVSSVELQVGIMNGLAASYWFLGKYKEAESLFEKILQLIRRELKEENVPLLPAYKCNLANVYKAQGRYEEAERLFVETLKTAQWPEEHRRAELLYTCALADTYREQGRYDKAEPLFVKTLEKLRLLLGKKHLRILPHIYGLARLYMDQDRHEEAKTLFSEALQTARQRRRLEHPVTLCIVNGLAVLHTKQKQYDQAKILFDEALTGRQREFGGDHPDTLESKNDIAVLYKEQARYEEAEPLLLEALEGRRLKLGDPHPHTIESRDNLIALYEAWGKPEKAEQWRSKLARRDDAEERD